MQQASTDGRTMREIEVGEDVFCRQGDSESVLATTHKYRISEMRRNAEQHVEVRVQNSLGEDMPGWFPIWPHFEPYTQDNAAP
jgi:hypothetical protein